MTWKNLGYHHPAHLPYDAQLAKDAADADAVKTAEADALAQAEADALAEAEAIRAEELAEAEAIRAEADKVQAAANAAAILALSPPVVEETDDLVGDSALRIE